MGSSRGCATRQCGEVLRLPSGARRVPVKFKRQVRGEGAIFTKWVCLKMLGMYIPNEIAIFHRDNDQQNHWV